MNDDRIEKLERDVGSLKTEHAVLKSDVERVKADVRPLLSIPTQIATILVKLDQLLQDKRDRDSEGGPEGGWPPSAKWVVGALLAALLAVVGVKAAGLV